jgi:hypothetical protein
LEYRLGPRQYSAPLPENGYLPVRVTEDAMDCVVFLGWQKAGPADIAPIDPKGTGFLMATDPAHGHGAMLVTARHVAEMLHPPFVIRMNKKGGGSDLVHIERPTDIMWCFHPTDSTADIAVAPFAIPNWANVTCYATSHFLGHDAERLKNIYAGDATCIVGLFYRHYGDQKNQPIVHNGHIAMLPSDPILVEGGAKRRGYLVEINGISGCSGSPVFALNSVEVNLGGDKFIAYGSEVVLLGVWSSSWKVKSSEITTVRTDDDDKDGTLAPLGMGIVTPGAYLAEILGGDDLRHELQELEKRRQDKLSATPDVLSGHPAKTADENPNHLEDFNRLVDVAARKRP